MRVAINPSPRDVLRAVLEGVRLSHIGRIYPHLRSEGGGVCSNHLSYVVKTLGKKEENTERKETMIPTVAESCPLTPVIRIVG